LVSEGLLGVAINFFVPCNNADPVVSGWLSTTLSVCGDKGGEPTGVTTTSITGVIIGDSFGFDAVRSFPDPLLMMATSGGAAGLPKLDRLDCSCSFVRLGLEFVDAPTASKTGTCRSELISNDREVPIYPTLELVSAAAGSSTIGDAAIFGAD
jgi:hypothetical protein